MTELLAVVSQKCVFKTGKKFCPHRGSNSRPSRFYLNALTAWAIGPYWYDDYYSPFSPNFIKFRPVVHEKQLSRSQIRISIQIKPNFELDLPMIITSLLTKFHQNPTSNLSEILLTNKQTNKHTKVIAISRFSRDKKESISSTSVNSHCGHFFSIPVDSSSKPVFFVIEILEVRGIYDTCR